MESGEVQEWLRERYRSAPSEGPLAKKMKFGDLQDALSTHFSLTVFNPRSVSAEIKYAFPNTFSKAVGKGQLKYVFGIEKVDSESLSSLPSTSKSPEHEALKLKVRQLEERVQELERELEQPRTKFSHELNSLLAPNHSVYHGPNDITNFDSFSMESIVAEFTKLAPKLFELFQTLGQTARHTSSCDNPSDDVMAVMSLLYLAQM